MGMRVEGLARQRRSILLGSFVGFALWQGGMIALDVAPASGFARTAEGLGLVVGAAVWLVSAIRMRLWSAQAIGPAGRALTDELWRHRTLLSFTAAFLTMGLTEAATLFVAIVAATPPTAKLAAQIAIYVGVLTWLGTFLYLDRD